MEANACCIILTIAVQFLPGALAGPVESPLAHEKSFLTDRLHPALVGIDSLRARILRGASGRDANGLDWAQLYAKVTQKFDNAGVKLDSETSEETANNPELRIYVEILRLEDSPKRVFRVQTSLARTVCLTENRDPIFKAEIWQTTPVMRAVSADELPARVMGVVLEQVEAFVLACKASNPRESQPSEDRKQQADSPRPVEDELGQDARPAATDHKYVASKSSSVFHKPQCRWAQNIAAENLVRYSSKEEAAKDGKRPCKSCNP